MLLSAQLITSTTAIGVQCRDHSAVLSMQGGWLVKMKSIADVIFQMQHFLTVVHGKSNKPQPLLGNRFHYTVPKGYFVQNPKFQGRGGVICPHNGYG